jgi:hypothetical protein
MPNKRVDEYIVPFKGAKLKKRLANQVGFALICGMISAVVVIPTIGTIYPLLSKGLVLVLTVVAFLLYGHWMKGT